jgi:TrmH RNA methyltransferase
MASKKRPHQPEFAKQRREVKIYGFNACAALWEHRRDDIIRVYVRSSERGKWSALLKWCAEKRLAYHLVEDEELERVSGTLHHEGVCFLAREARGLSERQFLDRLEKAPKASMVLFLDDVENPHNVGAILRVCAHFGVAAVVISERSEFSLSGAACRISEGGAEAVSVVRVANLSQTLAKLRAKKFKVVATTSHTKASLFQAKLRGNVIFLFGSEGAGLSKSVLGLSDEVIAVPGTGSVESLNVACAATAICSEWWRQNP